MDFQSFTSLHCASTNKLITPLNLCGVNNRSAFQILKCRLCVCLMLYVIHEGWLK